MQVEQYEINGFVIDKFNQYGLEVGKKQGVCPNSPHVDNLKIMRRSVLHMIGNVVLELATTVIKHFNYTRMNVKEQLIKNMLVQVIHQMRNLIFLVLK